MTSKELIEHKVSWGMSRERAEFEDRYDSSNLELIVQMEKDHPEWMPVTYNED